MAADAGWSATLAVPTGEASAWTSGYRGEGWRAVPAVRESLVLDGTDRAGRYNRPGERTLYLSGSPAGVVAAMRGYGEAPRVLVQVVVEADGLVDLRNEAACGELGIKVADAAADWLAALERGEEPPSWRVADRARAAGAMGLIDASRSAPGEWHLVLFRWNVPGGALVTTNGRTAA